MFYIVYKITNTINGKIYIGKHQTENLDDGYMGSGKLIKKAIVKYGIENFTKEILFQFNNEDEMNAKESELVTEEFIIEDTNYNLCHGGHGGFGYLNDTYWTKQKRLEHNRRISPFGTSEFIENHRNDFRNGGKKGSSIRTDLVKKGIINPRTFLGKKHTEETKEKMRMAASGRGFGESNSQYGTIWISNGVDVKKIKSTDEIPDGWHRGRK